jgi:hypothetical protein
MDAIKGLARRATQTLREKVSNVESTSDEKLEDGIKKIRAFEKAGVSLSEKILKVAKQIEDIGSTLRDIADEYRQIPDHVSETTQMAEDLFAVGQQLVGVAQDHQKPLKDQGFDLLGAFIRDLQKLKEAEDDRKKKQLEFDFFKKKVVDLRKDPPKDFTRIPRNEQILEQWRQELWKATEHSKMVVSGLYAQGQRSLDQTVLMVIQVVGSFTNITGTAFKQKLSSCRLPLYSSAPLLQPAPLPPNPLPPWQPQCYPSQGAVPPNASFGPGGPSPGAALGNPVTAPGSPPHGWQQPNPQQSWQAATQAPQSWQQATAQQAQPQLWQAPLPTAQQPTQGQPQTWQPSPQPTWQVPADHPVGGQPVVQEQPTGSQEPHPTPPSS